MPTNAIKREKPVPNNSILCFPPCLEALSQSPRNPGGTIAQTHFVNSGPLREGSPRAAGGLRERLKA